MAATRASISRKHRVASGKRVWMVNYPGVRWKIRLTNRLKRPAESAAFAASGAVEMIRAKFSCKK